MAQYISKDALVAKIEKRINEINLDSIEDWRYRLQWEHDIEVMKNILSIIDTLEVKEVNPTDTFIEKARKWFEKQNEWRDINGIKHCDMESFENFVNYMKGE